jgi:hypothetical protein
MTQPRGHLSFKQSKN